jgi:hypothetical protein
MPSFDTSGLEKQAFTLAASIPAGSNTIGAVNQAGTWNIGTLTTITNAVTIQDGGNSITVDNGGTFATQAAQSGTWNITNISGTVSLPTGAATAAKQPALGTAGTPSSDVLTVQGVTSMTALKVDGSGVTQPVSASSLPLPTGASTAAKQPALGTAGSASADVLTVQGIASMTALKVDGSAVTQPVSNAGTFAVQAAQSGTWNVGLNAGTNGIGKLTANSGVDIGDVDVTSVTPGTGATSLGKAEDAAHSSGDVGVMALAVRNDAGTALAGTTGDYIPLSTDANGALRVTGGGGGTEYTEGDTDASITGSAIMWEDTSDTLRAVSAAKPLPVNIISGAGSGGTAMTDDAAFTPGTTSITPVGGTYRSVRDSVDDNDGGALAMTAKRALYTTLETPNGDSAMDETNDAVRVNLVTPTALPVTDNGGSLTVDGTVTANAGTGPWPVTDNGGSLTVDNGGTFAVQAAQSGTWTVQPGNTANTTAWKVDNSAVTQPANVSQINGVTPLMGNGTTGTGSLRVTLASDTTANSNPFLTVGNVAHDAADSGNPMKVGGKARTTNPTAVADGDRVDCFRDDVGRSVVVMNQCRDLVGTQQTTITSSTSETTIVTAGGAGVFNDLTSLAITNSSATALIVTLKDSTAGTTRGIYAIAANGGIVLTFPTPKAQGTANNNWTLTCGTSVASIYVVAEFVKNV